MYGIEAYNFQGISITRAFETAYQLALPLQKGHSKKGWSRKLKVKPFYTQCQGQIVFKMAFSKNDVKVCRWTCHLAVHSGRVVRPK